MLDIYRMGYYQGHGGRLVMKLGPFRGQGPARPARSAPSGCASAPGSPCTSITIPADWTSGVYLGKLTAEREGLQSYVIFVVRDDRKADFLFQVSDTTWNAYNRWPSQFSLYDDGKKDWYWGPDVQTSFDRPYGKYCQILDAPLSVGSGEFLLWEFPLAYWMEQQGYDVTYISNLDTHADPAGLRRAKGWLSVGHDEYWSLAMFENMKRMVAEGLNLAFLSGNSICGVIDIHPSSDGRPDRIIERVGRFGSPAKEEIENGFPEEARFTKNGPNEATLIGARSTYPIDRRRRLDLPQARPLALRRHGDEGRRRHPGPRRLGVARRPGDDPRAGGRRQRHDQSPRGAGDLHRDDLSRARRGTSSSTRRRSGGPTASPSRRATSGPPSTSAEGARSTRAADHQEPARPDARGVR